MPNRQAIGLIPSGHIPLTQFVEDAVCRLYGNEAIAEIISTRTTGSTFFELDDGDGEQTLQNADVWITRQGGQEVSRREDAEQWDHARQIIKDAFAKGSLPAIVDGCSIHRDFWEGSMSELALVSGTYDVAPDPAHEGKPIFVSQNAAAKFIRSIAPVEKSLGPRVGVGKLKAWLQKRYNEWPDDVAGPGIQKDWDDARNDDEFKNVGVTRRQIEDARKSVTSPARFQTNTPGPKPKS